MQQQQETQQQHRELSSSSSSIPSLCYVAESVVRAAGRDVTKYDFEICATQSGVVVRSHPHETRGLQQQQQAALALAAAAPEAAAASEPAAAGGKRSAAAAAALDPDAPIDLPEMSEDQRGRLRTYKTYKAFSVIKSHHDWLLEQGDRTREEILADLRVDRAAAVKKVLSQIKGSEKRVPKRKAAADEAADAADATAAGADAALEIDDSCSESGYDTSSPDPLLAPSAAPSTAARVAQRMKSQAKSRAVTDAAKSVELSATKSPRVV
jgi:hypothetical protein